MVRVSVCFAFQSGWGIMFIYDMVLWCAGTLKPSLSLDQLHVQQLWHPQSYTAINRLEMALPVNLFTHSLTRSITCN